MEGYIRVSAKTVEDAIIEASIQLGTSSDNIEYTIIERETKGFLGIGAKKAVIEAKKKKDETEEDIINEVFGKKEKKSFEKKNYKENRELKKDSKEEKECKEGQERKPEREFKKGDREPRKDFKEGKKEGRRELKKDFKDNRRGGKPEVELKSEEAGEKPEFKAEKSDRKPEPKPELKPEKTDGKTESQTEALDVREEFSEETAAEPKQSRQPMDPKEAERRAEEFLKNMFGAMDMQVEIHAEYIDDTLNVDISGDEMGVLIGKRGQTLDSIQYLVSLVVNKGKSSYVRVKLDTENYRNRRKATLENLAKNIAFKVKKTRRPVYLEPMNPYERRIIHSALQNDPYVTTHSEGEEPCRKVVVTLKKRERNYYHNREQREQRED